MKSLSRKEAFSLTGISLWKGISLSFPNRRLLAKFWSLGVHCLNSLKVKDRAANGASLEYHNFWWMIPLILSHISVSFLSTHILSYIYTVFIIMHLFPLGIWSSYCSGNTGWTSVKAFSHVRHHNSKENMAAAERCLINFCNHSNCWNKQKYVECPKNDKDYLKA